MVGPEPPKKEEDPKEPKEPEVWCDSPSFRHKTILTSLKERRRKGVGRDEKRKDVEEVTKITNETAEEVKPPDRTTAAPIRTTTGRISPPATRATQPGARSDNDVANSSSSTDNVNEPSLPPTPHPGVDSGEDTMPSVFLRTFAF